MALGDLVGDDSGANTFAKYRYQSKLTLLHWIRTLLPGGPVAVYAEHVEDLVEEFDDRYVFVQIKGRDDDVGLWNATTMTADDGGVASLCRAYAVAKDMPCTFELHLEGGTSPSSATKDFVADCTKASATLRGRVKALLDAQGLDGTACLDDFLKRLRIRPSQPSQAEVDSVCQATLMKLLPALTGGQIGDVYDSLLAAVELAQEAKHSALGMGSTDTARLEAHLGSVLGKDTGDDAAGLIASKRLSAAALEAALPSTPAEPAILLLARVAAAEERGETALTRKLIAAGAGDQVVEDARFLRAVAETRRLEILSSSDSQADRLEDLSKRLLLHARAVALLNREAADPANAIWGELMGTPGVEEQDQFHLFNDDRQSLVGLLCTLSDECKFGWAAQ